MAKTARRPRRAMRRRRVQRRRVYNMGRIKDVVPNRYFTKLKYYSGPLGTTTTTSPGAHVFRLNSIQDPDFTGAGHQPMGHDQLVNLYSRYRVLGVKVRATFGNLTAGAHSKVGILPMPSYTGGTPPATLTALCENKGAICKTTSYEDNVTISAFLRPYLIEGITKRQYIDENAYAASFTSNPGSQQFLTLFWQNIDETTSTGHHVALEMTYYVLIDIPYTLGTS